MVPHLISPHGGKLINREVQGEEREYWLQRAQSMPSLTLSRVAETDLLCIAIGAFSPLTGFVTQEQYTSIAENMRLPDGTVWSIPITLPVPNAQRREIAGSSLIALRTQDQRLLAVMQVEDCYQVDRQREALQVFGTQDEKHPGVQRISNQSPWYVGGEIWLLQRPHWDEFSTFAHDPAQTRAMFQRKGWRRIVGFQTRNPVHRAHEYIQKAALETVDALFLHPLVGETKSDDLPASVRLQSYLALLRSYYPQERVLFALYPASMRYAGPREAILHALVRKNYGCSHFIVGRDHAGVGDYYGTYEAQEIFHQFTAEELGITPLFFEHCFYCKQCQGMASYKTCPHPSQHHVILSGTKVRSMLQRGETPPPEFSRPEVVEVLIKGLQSKVTTK